MNNREAHEPGKDPAELRQGTVQQGFPRSAKNEPVTIFLMLDTNTMDKNK